jgi:pSer/pThr/pTyr-binding forkhead associated (FHA) protein
MQVAHCLLQNATITHLLSKKYSNKPSFAQPAPGIIFAQQEKDGRPHTRRPAGSLRMKRTILPHTRILETCEDYSPNRLNRILHSCLVSSRENPCYLELSDEPSQLFLFFRHGQIYAAGSIKDDGFNDGTIKDFLIEATHKGFPLATSFEVSDKILHSILILFQKKPSLKTLSTLVDLDELLDNIESEGKSCIASASWEDFLAILRYEQGKAAAFCFQQSSPTPKEGTFREDFLVQTYTISAQKPVSISLHEDLLVTFAKDAKTIDDSFQGDLVAYYLSKPPYVSLEFKGKEISRFVLDKSTTKIGRTQGNDIIIDNLAVSRLHATIEAVKGQYYLQDRDSLNGTLLNGNRIGRAKLTKGDRITIGKHTIVYRLQEGCVDPSEETIEQFDQTMVINTDKTELSSLAEPAPEVHIPTLVQKTNEGDRVIKLKRNNTIIGKTFAADIEINGFLIAKQHAEIAAEDGTFVLRHLNGLRRVTVAGKPVREHVLQNNDIIRIGNEEFIFQE